MATPRSCRTPPRSPFALLRPISGSPWRSPTRLPPPPPVKSKVPPYAVVLTWVPAEHAAGLLNSDGGDTVYASGSPFGPFNAAKTVFGKQEVAAGFIDFLPGTIYYDRVDTFSWPHDGNPNLICSRRTDVLTATTPTPWALWMRYAERSCPARGSPAVPPPEAG